jgi:hypothetical protein
MEHSDSQTETSLKVTGSTDAQWDMDLTPIQTAQLTRVGEYVLFQDPGEMILLTESDEKLTKTDLTIKGHL